MWLAWYSTGSAVLEGSLRTMMLTTGFRDIPVHFRELTVLTVYEQMQPVTQPGSVVAGKMRYSLIYPLMAGKQKQLSYLAQTVTCNQGNCGITFPRMGCGGSQAGA